MAKSVDEMCFRYVASFHSNDHSHPVVSIEQEFHASIHCARALPFRCIFIAGSKCSKRALVADVG
jgi:hypothetical protein